MWCGDRHCPAGTHIELPFGAAFGPFVAGESGTLLLEVMMGDPRSWGDDPDAFHRALAARGAAGTPRSRHRIAGLARGPALALGGRRRGPRWLTDVVVRRRGPASSPSPIRDRRLPRSGRGGGGRGHHSRHRVGRRSRPPGRVGGDARSRHVARARRVRRRPGYGGAPTGKARRCRGGVGGDRAHPAGCRRRSRLRGVEGARSSSRCTGPWCAFKGHVAPWATTGGCLVLLVPTLSLVGAAGYGPWAAVTEGQRALAKAAARAWGVAPSR